MVKVMRIAFVLGIALSLGTTASTDPSLSPSLEALAIAETDFRACDRDWNRVNDFWTFNVEGLYAQTSDALERDSAEESPD